MKRFLTHALVVLGLPVGVALGTAAPAAACDTPALSLDQRAGLNFVFKGEVTDVAVGSQDGARTKVYSIDVDSWWRGDLGEEVKIASPERFADCGLQGVRAGRSYVFFANTERDGLLRAQSFEGTTAARPTLERRLTRVLGEAKPAGESAAAEPTALNPTRTVLDHDATPQLTEAVMPAAIGVLLGALLVGAGAILGRREH